MSDKTENLYEYLGRLEKYYESLKHDSSNFSDVESQHLLDLFLHDIDKIRNEHAW